MNIKYRAKRVDNGEWVYGVPVPNSFGDKVFMIHLVLGDKVAFPLERLHEYCVEVVPETIGQFVGLTDDNHVEIYDGSVVLVSSDYGWSEVSEVVWGLSDKQYGNYPAFSMPNIETEMNSFAEVYDSGDYNIEIVGNIHDNPELIEK
ncbi:YopX family protein [uncultured Vagococcus sp.]|uniref:YopX family protein n=1 Tax=uncultured Vagococcus sp. TaxID=189676 RepID=UPI0028D7D681|nr:YopX family protein [uncultured Vagococcus sp.]